ncbi:phosphopantetheine-binding protein [Streptomyces sp. NPDC046832]|uniref:phosphopantetheine-binding protein n=1 Tax=Streptomyces sp. NPDC046832 TaxID=3155020 RepID=UPI0033F38DCA
MTQNPNAEVEQLILDWSSELLEEQVNGTDNFLDMGGHSVLALDLIARIKERFGVDVDLQLLFEHTFSEVAADVAHSAKTLASKG